MTTDTLPGRLHFLRIDADTKTALRAAMTVVEPELDGILSRFYQHLQGQPKLSSLIGAPAGVLKDAQKAHWKGLFTGAFDAAYLQRATAIGEAHRRIGLEPQWYIGGTPS